MKRLGILDICGYHYTLYSASEASHKELRGTEGICDHHGLRLIFNNKLFKGRVSDAMLHEVLHAIFDGSGVDNDIANSIKKGVDPDELCERIIRAITPHLLQALRQCKGLIK